MSASLVGSEMCIRDRAPPRRSWRSPWRPSWTPCGVEWATRGSKQQSRGPTLAWLLECRKEPRPTNVRGS
eukprot:13827155-Alexandrium_andersonii.AAC.1